MAAGIGEAGRAQAPGPVQRAVQEGHPAPGQFGAHRVGVVDPDRQLIPRAGVAAGHRPRLDQFPGRRDLEQVDDGGAELEHRGIRILEQHGQAEDLLVKRLRALQVLGEHGDRADTVVRQQCTHGPSLPAGLVKSQTLTNESP
jgi:hypothetical protein